MPKYLLRRTWFGPDGYRYRPDSRGTNIPAKYVKALPADAVPFDQAPPVLEREPEPDTLSQLALSLNPSDPTAKSAKK